MRITKLILVQTGTYNDMVSRPYYTNLDSEAQNQFQEATAGGTNLSVNALAGVAGNILKPKAQAEGLVQIAGGWNEPRLRFMMEVDHGEKMGARITQMLCGYTDFMGATPTGAIAPDMRLFFNSSMTLRHLQEATPTGRVTRSNITDASHILAGNYNNPMAGFHENVSYCMRPEDLFCSMETATLGEDAIDLRSAISSGNLKKSRRSNGSASNYLSRVMQSYKHATAEDDYGSTAETVLNSARGNVREGMVSQDMFLSQMMRMSQLQENGSLSYGELQSLDPHVDHVAIVNLMGETHRHALHHAGQTEHWGGSNTETVAATLLSNSVPSIMMDTMLTRINFMTTNETHGGLFETRVLGVTGFNENLDLSPYVERFVQRMEVEVLRDLTRNHNISIALTMSVDILGDTHVNISLNGQPAIDYVTPSFCDGLMAPVLTQDQMTLHTVSSDVETLLGGVGVDFNQELGPITGGNDGYNSIV